MLLLFCSDEGSMTDVPADLEARHLIRKIRRQVRLLNRKWVEINQRSNEWQRKIDEVIEVNTHTLIFKI